MKIFAILMTIVRFAFAFAADEPCCNCPPPKDDTIFSPHSCNMCYGHKPDEYEQMLANTT